MIQLLTSTSTIGDREQQSLGQIQHRLEDRESERIGLVARLSNQPRHLEGQQRDAKPINENTPSRAIASDWLTLESIHRSQVLYTERMLSVRRIPDLKIL